MTTLIPLSPIIKAPIVLLILSLVVTHQWPIHQLDIKNNFLIGTLNENVYMEQPSSYVNPRFVYHVCHLKKALYGLKQARRAWFHWFNSFLVQIGFTYSRANTSLFLFHKHFAIIYLFLYINDVIIIGNNMSLDSFTRKLHSKFDAKDLGSLNFFLGLEATPISYGLFLCQLKYVHNILSQAQMLDDKFIATHMVVSRYLSTMVLYFLFSPYTCLSLVLFNISLSHTKYLSWFQLCQLISTCSYH